LFSHKILSSAKFCKHKALRKTHSGELGIHCICGGEWGTGLFFYCGVGGGGCSYQSNGMCFVHKNYLKSS
jgi:hypothetical protein